MRRVAYVEFGSATMVLESIQQWLSEACAPNWRCSSTLRLMRRHERILALLESSLLVSAEMIALDFSMQARLATLRSIDRLSHCRSTYWLCWPERGCDDAD